MDKPDWTEWGETTPSKQIALLVSSASVAEETARFTVNTIRVALNRAIAEITPDATLKALEPAWLEVSGLRGRPLYMAGELHRLLRLAQWDATQRGRWDRLTVCEVARLWQQTGLPVCGDSAAVMMKYYLRYGTLGDCTLTQFGHRTELPPDELREQYWPHCPATEWQFVVTAFQVLEREEATPKGFFRPRDLLGMYPDDLIDLSRAWNLIERTHGVRAKTWQWNMPVHECSGANGPVSDKLFVHCCHTVDLVVHNVLRAFGEGASE